MLCPHCFESVSMFATRCPHCVGEINPVYNGVTEVLGSVTAVIVILVVIALLTS